MWTKSTVDMFVEQEHGLLTVFWGRYIAEDLRLDLFPELAAKLLRELEAKREEERRAAALARTLGRSPDVHRNSAPKDSLQS